MNIMEVLNEGDDPLPDIEAGSDILESVGVLAIRRRDIFGSRRASIFVAPISGHGDTVLGVI